MIIYKGVYWHQNEKFGIDACVCYTIKRLLNSVDSYN